MRISLLTLLLTASIARADLPSPRFDRMTPLGGTAGATVEVDISGADIDEVKELRFDRPGFKAEFVKDKKFKIAIAADVSTGTYDVRLVGKYGVSNSRLLAVSRGLTEVAKKGQNNDIESAQPIAVNSVVNGSTDGNREDVFKFPLKQGQRIVIDCQAQKLDSTLDATMTLMDATGKQLASNGDYNGRDPLIDYIAAKDGDCFVSVYDLSFRGGLPYRLVVTDQPHVENVFPRAVQVGKPATFTIYGRNLGPKSKPSAWKINDLPLDEMQESIDVPDVLKLGEYRFTDHPTRHAVLPTAATCTLRGFQVHGIPVMVTDTAVTLEVEPNDDPKKPQPITLPAVVSGRFDKERDADWYEFETKEDGPHFFEVYCERIAGQADAYLVVLDDKDGRVAELDDFGIRTNAFDGHLRDPSGSVNLTKNRKYRVLVQDRYRRGGARFQYVLTIQRPQPDFHPAVIHSQNPGPAGLNIRKGGAAYLDVIIHNKDGFAGPLTITAEGLPKGLHALPTTIVGDTRGAFVVWADADAPDFTGSINLIATGKRSDIEVKREVRPYSRVWNIANVGTSCPSRDLAVAIRELAPFSLKFAAERLEVQAGKKTEIKLQLERIWPEFKNSVNILPLVLPGPIKMSNTSIAEGKGEATIAFDIQANAKPGEYTIAVIGQAQVPFAKDAKSKGNTLVAQPSRPFTLVILPGKK